MKQTHIMIGEIVRPQGVRGEVKVRPITCDYTRFEGMDCAFFKRGDEYIPVKLRVNRVTPEGIYMVINDAADRDAAEKLRGEFLYVDRAHSVALTEDETLICDLIGLRGVCDDGAEIGRLVDVLQPGGNDVYVFNGPRGEVLVPALKSVVKEVDVDGGVMLLVAERMAQVAVYSDEN